MKPAVARPRVRTAVAFATSLVCLVLGGTLLLSPPTSASDPESQIVRLSPTTGRTTYTWTGEVPVSASAAAGPCLNDPLFEDIHILDVQHTKAGLFREVNAEVKITIRWDATTELNDLAVAIYGPAGGVLASADTADPFETVTVTNIDEGEYSVAACGYTNPIPQAYEGLIEVTTSPRKRTARPTTSPTVPAAPTSGGGSGASGGGSSLPFAPTAPAVTVPQRFAPGAGRVATPFSAPTTVPVSEAAPAAFQGLEEQGVFQRAPEPIQTIAEDTTEVPWWTAVVVIVAGLLSGAYGLFERRRRHLDVPPGSALVPVAG